MALAELLVPGALKHQVRAVAAKVAEDQRVRPFFHFPSQHRCTSPPVLWGHLFSSTDLTTAAGAQLTVSFRFCQALHCLTAGIRD